MSSTALAPDGEPTAREGRERGLLLAVVAALTLPFLARPFHIDDDVYLWGARQILVDPADPLGGSGTFIGERGPLYHFTQHPPGLSFFLALAVTLAGGEREAPLHAAFLVFPLTAALALLSLARRFTRLPLLASLLVLATPAFVVMSHGLMTDVPLLALWLGATAATVRGVDRGAARPLALAGLLTLLAAFVQYRGALLVPLLLAYPLVQRRPLRPLLAALLPTPLLLATWSWHTWRVHGIPHLLDAGSWIPFDAGRLAFDAVAYVALLGGATLCPPLLLLLARARVQHPGAWIAIGLATAAATFRFTAAYTPGQRAGFAVFFGSGLAALVGLARTLPSPAAFESHAPEADRARARDDVFLLVMAAGPLASQVVLNLFASARSLLVALPFVVFALLRAAGAAVPEAVLRRRLWAGAGLTLVTALGVAVGDLRFAQAQQEAARRAASERGAAQGWFTGEWGFRHYMEREGLVPLVSDGSGIAPGDLVVIPEVPCPAALAPGFEARLVPVGAFDVETSFPLKVMSFRGRAGFYSNFHGLLPFALSDAPLESIRLFRVGPPRPR